MKELLELFAAHNAEFNYMLIEKRRMGQPKNTYLVRIEFSIGNEAHYMNVMVTIELLMHVDANLFYKVITQEVKKQLSKNNIIPHVPPKDRTKGF